MTLSIADLKDRVRTQEKKIRRRDATISQLQNPLEDEITVAVLQSKIKKLENKNRRLLKLYQNQLVKVQRWDNAYRELDKNFDTQKRVINRCIEFKPPNEV